MAVSVMATLRKAAGKLEAEKARISGATSARARHGCVIVLSVEF